MANNFPDIQAKSHSGNATGEPISLANGAVTAIHATTAGKVELVEVYVSNPTTSDIKCRVRFGANDVVVTTVKAETVPLLISRHELGTGTVTVNLFAEAAGLFGWAIVTEKTPV